MDKSFLHAYSRTLLDARSIQEMQWFAKHLLKNKLNSKDWLFDELSQFTSFENKSVLILGSWYPTYLPYKMNAKSYTCVDIDNDVMYLSKKFHEHLGDKNKFYFIQSDVKKFMFTNRYKYDIIINTSCEHMEYDMKDIIYDNNPIYVFQSNDYFDCDEHVNCKESLTEFKKSTGLSDIFYEGEYQTDKYKRFMVIGKI